MNTQVSEKQVVDEATRAERTEAARKKRTAFALLLVFLNEIRSTLKPELQEALSFFDVRKAKSAKNGVHPVIQFFSDLFSDSPTKTEDEVYVFTKQYFGNGFSRTDMAPRRKAAIKNVPPDQRMWVDYNPREGMYTLMGSGRNAPMGWTGEVPIDVEDETA